jgi:hypothetical protein
MFYNTCRATKSAFRKRQLSGKDTINPKARLLNMQKREKLKNLLIQKFMIKYNIKNPDEVLEPVLSRFVQSEHLNDIDLKRLDLKIQNLIKNKRAKDTLKSKLTQDLQETENNNTEKIAKKSDSPPPKLNTINVVNTTEKNTMKNINEFPSINPLNTYMNTIAKNDNNRNRGFSSYMTRGCKSNYFKTPSEELAELEKELAEEESKEKKNIKKIDIPRGGDEWDAIVKYNKKQFDRQVLEEKMKEREVKKRTKEYLDFQIKEKIRREYEDELKEKEYNKLVEEHSKKMDEIERVKNEKIREQIVRLKENRDAQLKNEKTRKRIEELKEKKLDLMLVKNYKQSLENARKEKFERKKRENEALRKAIKENEIKKELLKDQLKKEKENDIKMNEERLIYDLKKESERNTYYDKIRNYANKYTMKQAEEIVEKMKNDQKNEEEKIQYYYDAKNKEAHEKELKRRIKNKKEKEEMKKYLDMQIEEKKKEENLLKLLDEEQARIWNIDCKKYFDDENIIEKKIKFMNRKNMECLLKQIDEKKRSKSRQNIMTDREFSMNRDILEKARLEEKNEPVLA